MTHLISIIVPVYKVEKYLSKCLDSILAQTYKNLEVILVDDGSPDKCPEICDDYAQRDKRIRVIHKENAGSSSARNSGMSHAKGDYIGFVDSDDIISPNMYEMLYSLSQHHKADVVSCLCTKRLTDLFVGDFETVSCSKISVIKDNVLEEFTRKGCNSVWRRLYSKKILNDKQFVVGAIDEDILFSFQVMSDCKVWVTVSLPLYYWNQTTVSLSRSSLKSLHNPIEDIYKEYQQQYGNSQITQNVLLRVLLYRYRLVTRSLRFGFNNVQTEQEYMGIERDFITILRRNLWNIMRSPLYRPIDIIQLVLMSVHMPFYKFIYKKLKKS